VTLEETFGSRHRQLELKKREESELRLLLQLVLSFKLNSSDFVALIDRIITDS